MEIMDQCVHGEWDGDVLAYGVADFFVQPVAALRRLQMDHHCFFCAGQGKGGGVTKKEEGEVIGGVGAVLEEVAVEE